MRNIFFNQKSGYTQLILINVIIFVAMGALMVFSKILDLGIVFTSVYEQFSIPPRLFDFIQKPWTLITFSFAHHFNYESGYADILHILFNMLVLYWFGRLFVEYLGGEKIIALYVLGGIASGLTYLLVFNTIPYFKEISNFSGMVGASGAVFAIMVAISTLLPDYTFYLIFLGPVKIKYIVGFYIVTSFLGSIGSNSGGNIAHLGGALMGYIYIKQLNIGVDWGRWITETIGAFKNMFRPRKNIKVTYRKTKPTPKKKNENEEISQIEIDNILDKISEGGYQSLTKEEKEKLFKVSKK